ncbi:Hint domain-containing protein [Sulfitobacter aestuariivivens]|uniref:Hint domain-containing protein n=1 Tax=Sulfitobacter aestuariivivens TaxID=2766981 RepID=A0A927HF50_9RHOB|nr:Hint domain-containing protein [Sulfitobacter aestuariivivens]MBD3665482.1 Hint domain-containing protein [Sulfitobacter aestuariivivens]
MTWLALCDHDDRKLSLNGLGVDRRDEPCLSPDPRLLVSRGTLLFEMRLNDDETTRDLFGYAESEPWPRGMLFRSLPGGGVAFIQSMANHTARAEIRVSNVARSDFIRITYSWDAAARWARMTLEQPQESVIKSVQIDAPQPLSLGDLRDLMLGRGSHVFSADMIFAALSDAIEPVGPMPSLMSDVPIATPWDYKAAGDLRRGDTVTTRASGVVPVVHSITRTVPARGSFRPIHLRAPYFGLQQDITVSPEQHLLIDGPEVEYLFGQEAVLVPASHLVNGFTGFAAPCGPTVSYTQLLLPKHETMLAAGTALESLYIGRIRRRPDELASSVLRDLDRHGLPEHGRPSHQVLRHFEAIHLARQRAA